jgi:hypothetical protein
MSIFDKKTGLTFLDEQKDIIEDNSKNDKQEDTQKDKQENTQKDKQEKGDIIKNNWTEEELEKLNELYKENKSFKEISRILNRTENGVRQKIYNYLKIGSGWTEQDVELLKNNLDKTDKEIGELLGKTASAVNNKRSSMFLEKISKWTEAHDNLVKDLSIPVKDIAKRLDRSTASVYMRRVHLGVSNPKRKGKPKKVDLSSLILELNNKFGDVPYTKEHIKEAFVNIIR